MAPLAGIPIRDFDTAKGRLAPQVSPSQRREFARDVAGQVVAAAGGAGFDVVVVTGSDEVARWAEGLGVRSMPDPASGGLDAVSDLIAASAPSWCIIHGDLPLLTSADLSPIPALLEAGRAVAAPSRDGGTNVLAASGPVRMSYGPGSFPRHLAAIAHLRPVVRVSVGLCVEVDTYADLGSAARMAAGAWLSPFLS